MHLQDYNSAEAMAFNGSEATTATIQGHHTQEGQLSSTSEPYPSAGINSLRGERRGRTHHQAIRSRTANILGVLLSGLL